MAQIDSIDNLIAEFEKAAPAISQLHELAAEANALKVKLSQVVTDAEQRLGEIETSRQRLNDGVTEIGKLKQSLESRIAESKTLESNVGTELIRLKNEVSSAIGDLGTQKAELGVAIATFTTSSTQFLADKSSQADQAITDLKNTRGQELDDLKAALGAALHKATEDLPSQFEQLKEQLEQSMQTHLGNELQRFLERQNALVSNLNQRIDSLEGLTRNQQATARSQLESVLIKMKLLEEAIEKRRAGFLGRFR